jgi:uncharacterized protein involved in exopolysaccharide biosynthesis
VAAPPAPLPPELMAQADPQQAQSAFMANGVGQPQPGMQAVQQVMQKIQEQETWLQDVMGLLKQIHPPLVATLAPIAEATKQMRDGLNQVAKRSGMAYGSPMMGQGPQPGAGNPGAAPPDPMQM